jgi:hypothetical protein
MLQQFNRFLDWFSNYFAHRKGLLPLVGLILILVNFGLAFFVQGWVKDTNLFLHLGLVIAIIGFMVAWAL